MLRSLIVAVVAGIVSQGEIDQWSGGVLLGLALWVGFPLVLWVGALVHEKTPAKLAVYSRGRLAGEAARGLHPHQRPAVTAPQAQCGGRLLPLTWRFQELPRMPFDPTPSPGDLKPYLGGLSPYAPPY